MSGASAPRSADDQPWATPGNLCPEMRETHTGLVVMIGARAYKAKKPVVTDFLDFSTVASREQTCAREVDLNRRLAPDSYLGVGHFETPGGPAEPVIVMRRHPDSARLAALVRSGDAVHAVLGDIAGVLAGFHSTAERGAAIDAEATAEALTARWQENLAELRRHAGTIIAEATLRDVSRAATRYLAGRGELYAARIAAGRIVDGHGDLLTQDIFCLPEGPALLDCLEFDDRLRYVDGIDDAAFLAMDLEFLGRGDLGDFFLDEYTRRAGDDAPNSLRHFCIAYRAVVRAKVDCVRVGQGHPDAAADAERHLAIADEHLAAGAVTLTLVGGGPGTGKTTLARALAPRVHAHVLSTDDVRRELQESGAIGGRAGSLHTGLYTEQNTAAVYEELLGRARALLAAGHSVILDATWRDARQREHARTMASEVSSPVVEFACALPLSEAVRRIETRAPTTSDATPQIATALEDEEQGWPQAHRIDTSGPVADSVAEMEHLHRCAVRAGATAGQ